MPTFMILRKFGEKKFFFETAKKFFFRYTPPHDQKICLKKIFENFFFEIFLQNHKCRHKTIIETYFFQKIFYENFS